MHCIVHVACVSQVYILPAKHIFPKLVPVGLALIDIHKIFGQLDMIRLRLYVLVVLHLNLQHVQLLGIVGGHVL